MSFFLDGDESPLVSPVPEDSSLSSLSPDESSSSSSASDEEEPSSASDEEEPSSASDEEEPSSDSDPETESKASLLRTWDSSLDFFSGTGESLSIFSDLFSSFGDLSSS